MENVYELYFDLIEVVQIILVFTIFLVLILLKDRLNKNKYAFLLCWLLLLGVVDSYFLKFTHFNVPNFYLLFVFLAGPTLLYHIKEYQIANYSLRNTYFKHILVAIVFFLISLLNFSDVFKFLMAVTSILHFGCYLALSVQIVAKKKVILIKYSKDERNTLTKRWKRDFYFLLAIVCVYLTVIFESFFIQIKMVYRYTYIVILIMVGLLTLRMLYIKAQEIYLFYKNRSESKLIEKYKDSILSTLESKILFTRLEELMDQQQPYLDEELNLQSLASKLKTHQKHLSQAINENSNGNYFDFVSSYRIDLAQQMLLDPFYKDYKVYEIMYEVGFSSRSSFNTAFKKITGVTPKIYREQNV